MMDQDDLRTVSEDLQFLRDGWGPDIPDPDIRRGSATLRRLLVEDAYGQAWRQVGFPKQPKLIAVDLEAIVQGIEPHRFGFALAAGANFRGIYASGMIGAQMSAPPDSPPAPSRPNGYPGEQEFTLSEFLSSRSGIVDRHSFTRRDVIQYIAHVKGGVHLKGKGRRKELQLIARMKPFEKRLTFETTDGFLLELVAIAQAVGMSDDARKLVEAISQALGTTGGSGHTNPQP
jgi:hypothetical protein